MFRSSYTFNDPLLLEEAVTHKSWFNENCREAISPIKGYDRLEFLGDAVLKAIQAKYVFVSYPDWSEGQLSKTRSHLENNKQLATWCCHLGLNTIIKVGQSIREGSKAWDNICAQVFEAYIGAIWKDCHYDFNCLYDLYTTWDFPVRDQEIISPKNQLQEYVQRYTGSKPSSNCASACPGRTCILSYTTLEQVGPSHEPFFSVRCSVVMDVQQLPPTESDHSVKEKTPPAIEIETETETDSNRNNKRPGEEGVKSDASCQHQLQPLQQQYHTMGQGSTRKKAETEAARHMFVLLSHQDDLK